MSNFNIHEDLQSRPDSQKLEILAISGPTARKIMQKLVDGKRDFLTDLGLEVDEGDICHIIDHYSESILAPPPWERR